MPETAIKEHPDVVDALVLGRPGERWGTEVVAVLQVSSQVDEAAIKGFCGDRLARYKLPKQPYFVDRVRRLPAGKNDYKWAAQIVLPDNKE